MRIFALVFAAVAVSGAPLKTDGTCVMYFNFTSTNQSHTFFGSLNTDGTIVKEADLGYDFDPQGRFTLSPDGTSFAFVSNPLKPVTPKFGCCDPTAVQHVNMATGATTVTPLHRLQGVTGTKCGLFGCGFLEIGSLDANGKVVGWVEQLLPPAPPAAHKPLTKAPGIMGASFAEFDLSSGKASTIRPFYINDTAPQLMGAGMTSFEQGTFWFACSPDLSTNAVCSTPTTPGKTNAEIEMVTWSNTKMTITDMKYSKALQSPIVLAQTIATSGTVSTQVFEARKGGTWPLVADLGKAWGGLHQSTISPDGRRLVVNLPTGTNKDNPTTDIVTVDLVGNKVASRVAVKNKPAFRGPAITVLSAFAC